MASNLDQLTAMQNGAEAQDSIEPTQDQPPELDLRSAVIKGIKAGLKRRAEARAEQERMMLAKATAATAPLQGQTQPPGQAAIQTMQPQPQQQQAAAPQQQQPAMPPAFPPGQYPQVQQPQPGWQAPAWPPPYTMMPPGPGPVR